MKIKRKKFMVWGVSVLILFSLLPAVNWFSSKEKNRKFEIKALFSTDLIEGYFNYALFKHGVSGNYHIRAVNRHYRKSKIWADIEGVRI